MENCINSLLAGGERVEIIIDDGSRDNTGIYFKVVDSDDTVSGDFPGSLGGGIPSLSGCTRC
jgi:hypothetical protein